MKIVRVEARALNVHLEFEAAGRKHAADRPMNYVEIETDGGLIGHGASGHAQPEPVASLINRVLGPKLEGADPFAIEALWDDMHRALAGRGQSGIGWNALSMLDTALWDIKGKAVGQPLWRLLGGRQRLPLYATLPHGPGIDTGALARQYLAEGFSAIKLVVGGAARHGTGKVNSLNGSLEGDIAQVRALREAAGERAEIFLSAQCSYSLPQALAFARGVKPYSVALFQEPVAGNDPDVLARFRRESGIPTTVGHSLSSLERFRDVLTAGAADYVSPNVITCGGYTGALRAGAVARAFGVPIVQSGAWFHHNMHFYAAAPAGTLGEWFELSDILPSKLLYTGLPMQSGGWLTLPEAPGLGFEPDRDALKEWTVPH